MIPQTIPANKPVVISFIKAPMTAPMAAPTAAQTYSSMSQRSMLRQSSRLLISLLRISFAEGQLFVFVVCWAHFHFITFV